MKPRFLIGVDLGTTNCALSYVDMESPDHTVQSFKVPQWDGMGVIESPLLPSFIAFLSKAQIKRQEKRLDFHDRAETVSTLIGQEAKNLGIESPGRVISSAKSWLVHRGIDAESPILPWNSDSIIGKNRISPVNALGQLLSHLKRAWQQNIGNQFGALFADQYVVVTVPASFDTIAQQLTLKAAKQSGFPSETKLLEEPLAAFYAAAHSNPSILEQKGRILVCDIGGGTTDFTLLETCVQEGKYVTKRTKVGPHILLGGDNIDLALAHHLERQFLEKGQQLPSEAWAKLVACARSTKEKALAVETEQDIHISLDIGSGHLFSSTLSTHISRSTVLEIVSAFVPYCSSDASVQEPEISFKEWGLPYAHDCAITRHLAQFLSTTAIDHILFAGGTARSSFIRQRIIETIESWQDQKITMIHHKDHHLAVSLGACCYQLGQQQKGVQVEANYPYNLIIAAEQHGATIGICILSKGQKYGEEVTIDRQFKGLVNRQVQFKLYREDNNKMTVGDIVPLDASTSLVGNLSTKLNAKSKAARAIDIEISCSLHITGILELSCSRTKEHGGESWPITFDLQSKQESTPSSGSLNLQVSLEELSPTINNIFGKGKRPTTSSPKLLPQQLEQILGVKRKDWNLQELRMIWQLISPGMHRRSRSEDHEMVWLNLAGFTLRPGFGTSRDAEYIEDIWNLFASGPAFPKKASNQVQWHIMWRRLAGGLNHWQQEQVFEKIWPLLRKKEDMQPEVYLLAGSLERLEANKKIQLGRLIINDLVYGNKTLLDSKLWCLARLACRWPLYGEISWILRPAIVEQWVAQLLHLNIQQEKHLRMLKMFYSWAGRIVKDREFDLSQNCRETILEKLSLMGASEEQLTSVREYIPMNRHDQNLLFGEELPFGLQL